MFTEAGGGRSPLLQTADDRDGGCFWDAGYMPDVAFCTQLVLAPALPRFCRAAGACFVGEEALPMALAGHPISPGPDIPTPRPLAALSLRAELVRALLIDWRVLIHFLSFSFVNRRLLSTNPYLGGTSSGYAHPSGTALHYDDVPCIDGSVSVPSWGGSARPWRQAGAR